MNAREMTELCAIVEAAVDDHVGGIIVRTRSQMVEMLWDAIEIGFAAGKIEGGRDVGDACVAMIKERVT